MQTGIDIKIIILNNKFLGMVRQWQELFNERRYSFVDIESPDFRKRLPQPIRSQVQMCFGQG